MKETARKIAQSLLQIKAIKLNSATPFVWASGWKSPIYCDNRKILSYPDVRREVCEAFAAAVTELYPKAEIIAGVATGAIAHGVLVAEALGKPFIYVRTAPKTHGLSNRIEGEYRNGAKVVVVEDLISTGGSSLSAVEALRDSGCEVVGMVAVFTYGFPIAEANFNAAKLPLTTLSDYNTMIELAAEQGYIRTEELATLKKWREEPDKWMK